MVTPPDANLLTVSLLSGFSTPYLQIVRSIQARTRGYLERRPGAGFTLSETRNVPPEAARKAQAAFDAVASGSKELPEIPDRIVGE